MLIKNKLSREAFYQFLEIEHPGKDQLLSAFLVLEGIKRDTRNEPILSKETIADVTFKIKGISMTVPLDSGTIESQNYLIIQNMKDFTILTSEILRKKITQTQSEILLLMTPLYDVFLDSDNFKDYEIKNKEKEKRNCYEKSF